MFARGMKESNQEVVDLKDESISSAALKIVLDSMYSGDLRVNDENVFEVLIAADHLQVTSVIERCCDDLQTLQLRLVQYRHIVKSAPMANWHGLIDGVKRKEVSENEEFMSHFDAEQYSCLLCRDDLSAPLETFVFKSEARRKIG